ncbi:hypothetical protein Tco_0946910, partial [Tanacetum coccineum]
AQGALSSSKGGGYRFAKKAALSSSKGGGYGFSEKVCGFIILNNFLANELHAQAALSSSKGGGYGFAEKSMSSAQAALSSSKGGSYGFAEKGNSFASGDNASERKSIISYPPMYLVKESLTWVSNVESVGYTATLASLLTIEQFELASNGRKFNIVSDLVEEDKVAKWVIRAGLSKWVRIGPGRTGHLWNGLKCGHGQQELDWDSYEKMEREIALQKVPKSANVAKAKEMAQIRAER